MTDSAFLIVTMQGISRTVKSRPARGKPHVRPHLKPGEYAVLLRVTVPDIAFQPRPVAIADLNVSAQKLIAPPVEVKEVNPPPPEEVHPPLEEDPDYKAGRDSE